MMQLDKLTILILIFVAAWTSIGLGESSMKTIPAQNMHVTNMRCEYRIDPLGIDTPQPRLSWTLFAQERGQKQTAYQILVATDPQKLSSSFGDLFDSGKVVSDRSLNVVYAGKPLQSFQECFWRVRVWDMAGRPTEWSAISSWTMGVLDPKDWRALWIGYTKKIEGWDSDRAAATFADFGGAQWIWYPEGKPREQAPAGTCFFRGTLNLPLGARIQSARLRTTCDDSLKILTINGQSVSPIKPDGFFRIVQEGDVKAYLKPGPNVIATKCFNGDPSPAGFILKIAVILKDGQKIEFGTDAGWKAAKDEQPGWMKPETNASSWPAAQVLGEMGIDPWGRLFVNGQGKWQQIYASPILRKSFEIPKKPIRSAKAYVCGLGLFELSLNGRKVGDHELDPVHSNYAKRVYYVTFDIKDRLWEGGNVVGVMLGSGFYDIHEREHWDFDKAPWLDRVKLRAQIRIVYQDGTEQWIATDPSWRAAAGPAYLPEDAGLAVPVFPVSYCARRVSSDHGVFVSGV